MADWSTIASMSTAVGTLVLATATFSATRSANRSARIAERAFQAGMRPVLVQSRPEDPPEKFMWGDRHWSLVPGGRAWVEATPEAVYLAMSLRNVGAGMAVILGWHASPSLDLSPTPHIEVDEFRPQVRDLYVPPGNTSFWQGAFRDGDEVAREAFAGLIVGREGFTVELLYGDHDGGQRTISRFSVVPRGEDVDDPTSWIVSVTRHWNLDRHDPR